MSANVTPEEKELFFGLFSSHISLCFLRRNEPLCAVCASVSTFLPLSLLCFDIETSLLISSVDVSLLIRRCLRQSKALWENCLVMFVQRLQQTSVNLLPVSVCALLLFPFTFLEVLTANPRRLLHISSSPSPSHISLRLSLSSSSHTVGPFVVLPSVFSGLSFSLCLSFLWSFSTSMHWESCSDFSSLTSFLVTVPCGASQLLLSETTQQKLLPICVWVCESCVHMWPPVWLRLIYGFFNIVLN